MSSITVNAKMEDSKNLAFLYFSAAVVSTLGGLHYIYLQNATIGEMILGSVLLVLSIILVSFGIDFNKSRLVDLTSNGIYINCFLVGGKFDVSWNEISEVRFETFHTTLVTRDGKRHMFQLWWFGRQLRNKLRDALRSGAEMKQIAIVEKKAAVAV